MFNAKVTKHESSINGLLFYDVKKNSSVKFVIISVSVTQNMTRDVSNEFKADILNPDSLLAFAYYS